MEVLDKLQMLGRNAIKEAVALFELEPSLCKVVSSQGRDIKIFGDKILEEKIITYLEENGEYPVVGEESFQKRKDCVPQSFWVVDPIDGSFNCSREIPFYCISVGFIEGGVPILGFIYDLSGKKLYECRKSGVYDEENNQIEVSKITDLKEACLATGFPIYLDLNDDKFEKYVGNFKKVKKVRMFGSAAMSLLYVSMGRVDIYFERNIKLWDVAAGLAMVKRAGGNFILRPVEGGLAFDVLAWNNQVDCSEFLEK